MRLDTRIVVVQSVVLDDQGRQVGRVIHEVWCGACLHPSGESTVEVHAYGEGGCLGKYLSVDDAIEAIAKEAQHVDGA